MIVSFFQGSPMEREDFDNAVFDGTALRVRAVRTGQRGSYSCAARNALGEASSNRVKLDVRCEWHRISRTSQKYLCHLWFEFR